MSAAAVHRQPAWRHHPASLQVVPSPSLAQLWASTCPIPGTRPLPRSDIGCHIDGYIAQAAHSLVVAADAAAPVTGRAADVMQVGSATTEWGQHGVQHGRSMGASWPQHHGRSSLGATNSEGLSAWALC